MTDRLAEVFYSDIQMERLLETINKMSESLSSLATKAGVAGEQIQKTAKDATDSVIEASTTLNNLKSSLDEQNRTLLDTSEAAISSWSALKNTFRDASDKIKSFADILGISGEKILGFFQGLQERPESAIRGLINKIPGAFGIAAQMFFDTILQRARAESQAGAIFAPFAQVGGPGGDPFGGMSTNVLRARFTDRIRELESLGVTDAREIATSFHNAVRAGVNLTDTMYELRAVNKQFGNEAAMVALEVDKSYALAAGTVSKAAAEISRTMSESYSDNILAVNRLGAAVRQMSHNFDTVLASVMQTTSAFRVQGGDLDALTNTYMKLGQAATTMARGAKPERVEEITSLMFGDISKLSGVSENVLGSVIRTVAERMGVGAAAQNMTDVELLQRYKMGFMGMEGLSADKDLRLVTLIAKAEEAFRVHGKEPMTVERLLQMQLGIGPHLAKAVVDMIREGGLRGLEGMTSEQRQALQAQADVDRANAIRYGTLTNDSMQQMMKQIQQLMLAISESIIVLLQSLVRVSVGGFTAVVQAVLRSSTDPLEALGEVVSGEKERIGAAFGRVGAQFRALTSDETPSLPFLEEGLLGNYRLFTGEPSKTSKAQANNANTRAATELLEESQKMNKIQLTYLVGTIKNMIFGELNAELSKSSLNFRVVPTEDPRVPSQSLPS